MASMRWKSAEILKVYGTTIREGTFTGGKATAQGVITKDEPTTFTPEYISKVYENVQTHVPFVLKHKLGGNEVIGYAYKVGISESKDDLKYTGFVFNQDAIKSIITGGYSSVSPEIDETKDSSGNVVDAKIAYIAFVPNPSIDGTEIEAEHVVFSKGEGSNMEGNTGTETTATQQTSSVAEPMVMKETTVEVPSSDSFGKLKASSETAEQRQTNNDVSNLNVKMDDYKTKSEQLAAKVDQLLTERYDVIVADLKTQGIDDPGAIVRGLPVEQKITVLSKMKDTVVKTKPLTSTLNTGTTSAQIEVSNDKAQVSKALGEVLGELGYTVEEYKHLRGE
jgi:hypothetical protein